MKATIFEQLTKHEQLKLRQIFNEMKRSRPMTNYLYRCLSVGDEEELQFESLEDIGSKQERALRRELPHTVADKIVKQIRQALKQDDWRKIHLIIPLIEAYISYPTIAMEDEADLWAWVAVEFAGRDLSWPMFLREFNDRFDDKDYVTDVKRSLKQFT